jgi:hypothetical protein
MFGYTSRYGSERLVITPAPTGPHGEKLVHIWAQYRKPYKRKDGVKRCTVYCTECRRLRRNPDEIEDEPVMLFS